jgi:hypothetical protein
MGRRHRHLNPRDAGAVVALDSRYITGLADGANMGTWSNRGTGGTTWNGVRVGTPSRVIYVASAQGGQPAVRLTSGANVDAAFRTTVGNPTSFGYGSTHMAIVANSSAKATSTERRLYEISPDVSAPTSFMALWAQWQDNNMYLDQGPETGSGRISGAVSTTSDSVVHTVIAGVGSSGSSVRRSGTAVLTGSMSGSVSTASHVFNLGGARSIAAGSGFYVGDFQAFIHGPSSSVPLSRRLEQSVAFSFKIPVG